MHDESILVYDAKIRHVWAIKGSKPRMLVTGSHKRTIVSGIITDKGEQIFRQYDSCNSVAFLDFLKVTLRKFPYLILFIDRAPWHKEKNVRKFIRKNKHRLKIRWFPPGFPESNPMEECWNQGKDEILGSKFYDSFTDFKTTVTNYYRTKRFKLDLYKYLCH